MPILFFLSLDLASFFMPDTRGDKLCFKVTVLLAMSVLLLILNDTFPSKPSKTPLMGEAHTHAHAHMRTHTHTHTRARAHTRTRAHARTHARTHAHTQAFHLSVQN